MANLEHLTNFMPYEWHKQKKIDDENHNTSIWDLLFREKDPWLENFAAGAEIFGSGKVNGSFGEMQACAWLNAITNEHNVLLNSVLIPNNQSISGDTELDLIWLGPHGVVVVEVKAFQGQVQINNASDWKGGNGYETWKIKSPVDQCMRQCKELRTYLKRNGLNIPVKGLIVMPKIARIEFRDKPRIPVIRTLKELKEFKNKKLPSETTSDLIDKALTILVKMDRA